MAIQKVNESLLPRGPVESMKQQGNEIAKPEAAKQKPGQLETFNETNKGFKIDTKA